MTDFAKQCKLEALKLEAQAVIAGTSDQDVIGRTHIRRELERISCAVRALANPVEYEYCETWDIVDPPEADWEFVAFAAVLSSSDRYCHDNISVTKWRRPKKASGACSG